MMGDYEPTEHEIQTEIESEGERRCTAPETVPVPRRLYEQLKWNLRLKFGEGVYGYVVEAANALVNAVERPAPPSEPLCKCGHPKGKHEPLGSGCWRSWQYGTPPCDCTAFDPAPPVQLADTPTAREDETLQSQIDRLAAWLMDNTNEPKGPYGAVDAAINHMQQIERERADWKRWCHDAETRTPRVARCKVCGSDDLYERKNGETDCRECRRQREGMARRLTLDERMLQYSEPGEDGCLLWLGAVDRKGYGRIKVGGRMLQAHRVNYELNVGPIPDGLHLDHLCRNPPCIEPTHLEPVTPRENYERGIGPMVMKKLIACAKGHEWTTATTGMAKSYRKDRDFQRVCLTCKEARQYRECPECGKSMLSKNLAAHQRRQHGKDS